MRKNILGTLSIKILLCCGGLSLLLCSCSPASGVQQKQITTWNEYKWKNVHRQLYDYSCGAGALSTLIEFYFNDPAPEPFLLADMIQRLDIEVREDRKRKGFSIQDLKIQAESMGYVAAGVKLTAEVLISLKGPVIVLLEGERVNHFVVLKGIKDGKAYFADPQRGNINYSLQRFLAQWNGLALVLGKKGFGLPTDHLLGINKSLRADLVNSGVDAWRGTMRQMQHQPRAFQRLVFPLIVIE